MKEGNLDVQLLFNSFIDYLVEKKGFSREELLSIKDNDKIPICIFDNKNLSALEAIVKYLKENLDLSLNKIAELLKRENSTIWITYNNAKKKNVSKIKITECKYYIPYNIFWNRDLGVLESICFYLKNNYGLTYHQIAVFLNRDDRTIWTSYNKAKRKEGTKK